MKQIIQVILKYVPPYKKELMLSILFNLFSAVFTVFTFAFIQPVLDILFDNTTEVNQLMDWTMSMDALKNNLYYYITQIKVDMGADKALIFVGFFFVIGTMLKVGSAFMASYFTSLMRNNITRDIRTAVYAKIVSLPIPFFSDESKGDIMSRSTGDVG
ncbi:MAG: ABC transporter ATP-binding protein, partial [Erysipelotrichaceae bacterium]|nr:ABC transporter ATP-binding protein [Erysipelotrichaceae bacterium]